MPHADVFSTGWRLCSGGRPADWRGLRGLAGSSAPPLRLLVPAECAGRLIGRGGARIQEAQLRSGAGIQLWDRDTEKLVEVAGSWGSVDEATEHIVEDVARALCGRPGAEEAAARIVTIAALVPEALVGWVAGRSSSALSAGAPAALGVDGVTITVLGAWDAVSERRLALQGPPQRVRQALKVLDRQLRRYARWTSRCMHELPWELCDQPEAGDPEHGFISTENVLLALPEGASGFITGDGSHAGFLLQLEEETGAVLRVQAGGSSGSAAGPAAIEVAGSFGAKAEAVFEAALLAALVAEHAAGEALVELLLSGAGAELTAEEVSGIAAALGAEATTSRKRRGAPGCLSVRLRGPRGALSGAAVRLARAAERRAAARQRVQGPPPLLVDYLTRWFGREASRWLGGLTLGAERRARAALPTGQIASGADRRLGEAPAEAPAEEGPVLGPVLGPVPAAEAPEPEAPEPPTEAERKRGKRRRRVRLSNPFRTAEGDEEEEAPPVAAYLPVFAPVDPAGGEEQEGKEEGAAESGSEDDADLSLAAAAARAASFASWPAPPEEPAAVEGGSSEEVDDGEAAQGAAEPTGEGGAGPDPLWELRQALLKRLAAV